MVPPLKVGLYSAIYGAYDTPKRIPDTLGVPAVMYTDSGQVADAAAARGWEPRIRVHHYESPNGAPEIVVPMLNHKYWKCHPDEAMPDFDVSLWVDGSVEITVPDYVERCLRALGEDDWSCVKHPARDCIYPEAEFSAALTWRYSADPILRQAKFYSQVVGHPEGWGLIATGISTRRHTPEVIAVCHQWWHDVVHWSHQDQISLPVLLRLHPEVKFNYNMPWGDWYGIYEHR